MVVRYLTQPVRQNIAIRTVINTDSVLVSVLLIVNSFCVNWNASHYYLNKSADCSVKCIYSYVLEK